MIKGYKQATAEDLVIGAKVYVKGNKSRVSNDQYHGIKKGTFGTVVQNISRNGDCMTLGRNDNVFLKLNCIGYGDEVYQYIYPEHLLVKK